MSGTKKSFGKVIRDLILALLNATIVLVIIAVVLGLILMSKVESVTAGINERLAAIAPLKTRIENTTNEMRELKDEIALLRDNGDVIDAAVLGVIDNRMQIVVTNVADIKEQMAGLSIEPDQLVDHAIEKSTTEIGRVISGMRHCSQ
ncbi:MAG: hypothetical protein DHS20C01_06580 [marine bacterium B5-7]|nr:MAG: hypothetical protein DHS20C01_06580 [marine bacterium B5-7]